ncbi:hypothetical protein Tco_1499424 [Tanacetum coccineum]
MRHGFDLGYKTWVHHGEPDLPPPPPVIDNTRQPQMSDMTALLNDLSYIPPNNEHNEPTQGDIGETSNEPTQATRNEFEELYASANEELYPGCDYVTRLDFMAKFTYFKVKGKLTDSIFNEMLEFFQNVFPISKGYKLPPSYYAIKKTFKTIELRYESIHACEHDCCLFRGDDNKDLDFCPVCNTSRWKDSNTPGKKVPKNHATGKCTKPGKMQHPVDGRAWKNFDTKYSDFAKEPRNVRLGLADDGFNLFGNFSQAYSMWPVILTTYNLPPWLCMKESSFILTFLIPGPKSPGKDIDVYLRPLIEDLKVLWDRKGVETIDVASVQKFNVRAMVLWTINDFPARSSLSGWSGQGYKACLTCNEDTPFVRMLSKTACVGHRRFLKKPHKWRSSSEFNGQTDNRDPPKEFGQVEILAQLDRLPTRLTGKHPSYGGVKIKRNVLVELNWTKRQIRLAKLRHSKWLVARPNQKWEVLEASGCVFFHTREPKFFCQFIKGVKLPDGFGSCFKHKVTDNDTNITGLKSHDCHIMMQRLLPYELQNYLPDKIAKPIIELCSLFKQICSATLMKDDMLEAQIKVVDIMCDLELIYPPALFDIMIHMVIHLPLKALEGGPIHPRWMFPFERYMTKLKGYVRNKAKPKGSIAEGYVAEEALTFSSHYFRDIRQRHVDNDKDPEVSTTSELFALACGPTLTPISYNSCVVNGVRFVVHSRDERRTTQNSGICSPGGKDREMYDGQFHEILKFSYLSFKVVLLLVKWFDTSNEGRKVKHLVLRNNMTQIDCRGEAFKNDQYILVTQVKQVFYLEDKAKPHLKVVEHVNHKKNSNRGVIVVEDDPDIIHFDNLSDLPLSTNDDITDDEDALPHDLADFDDEDLINVDDDDGVDKMSADVAWSHGGDGGGTLPEPLKIGKTGQRARSYLDRDPGRLLAFEMRWQSSGTQEYPSLIDTCYVAHTVNGEFLQDEDWRIYINHLARRGKQRGHIPGFGRVLPARATAGPSQNSLHKKVNFMMSLFKSGSKYSDMFSQFESGGASGSGGCGDDEESADDQEDEDEDGDGDS